MNSLQARRSAEFFQRLDFKKFPEETRCDEKISPSANEPLERDKLKLKLNTETLETLFKNKDCLEDQSFETNIDWLHLAEKRTKPFAFSMDELNEQFTVLEEILERKYSEEANANTRFISKERDEFKVAIEQYKLAIMEAAFHSLKNNEEDEEILPPARTTYGLYYFLLAGGSWIAYLHGYDAAKAIMDLFPFAVPVSAVWTAGSLLFLIALGIFSAFEAEELSKHLGFHCIKNCQTTLDINQKQIDITEKFTKQLALHSEEEKIVEVESYEKYVRLAKKFDYSIKKTKERVENIPEVPSRKVAKITLLFCGMAFNAADEIFLVVGFGALALSGPWGWIIIAATALIGAVLFYVAFNHMIRDKVSPALKQKEDIQLKYAQYQKDNLLQSIEDRLAEKKHLDKLETELLQKKLENYQLILDQKRKDDELKGLKDELCRIQEHLGTKSGPPQKKDKKVTHIKIASPTPESKPSLLSILNFSKLRAIPPPIKKSPEEPTAIVLTDYFGHK